MQIQADTGPNTAFLRIAPLKIRARGDREPGVMAGGRPGDKRSRSGKKIPQRMQLAKLLHPEYLKCSEPGHQ